jgi:glycosyltransferase involved in cell wall biosynthesis
MPSVLMIMLCMRCRLGGAEKRYARIFEMLVAQPGSQHKLLINRSMLDLLQAAGILSQHDSYLIVLEPPFRRCVQSRGAHWSSRFLQPVTWLLDAFWYTWQCWRAVRRCRPEIVHPLLTGIYFSLPTLLLYSQVRHVMSAYSSQFESYRDKRILSIGLGATIKRYAMQHCHAIDALSMSIRDDLVVRSIASDKIQVAPCSFTDLSLCRPALQKKKWVVFLGSFVDIKNPLLLAQAVPMVLAQNPDVHFYFLGGGYLQSQLESLVQDLNIASYVTIRFEPYPTRILNQSSIFVSLQDKENYPSQSLLEAMACGNAIIATDVGETWRMVDEANGIRIPPTVDAVADAIVELMKDPLLIQRGLVSRQRVLSEHTAERFLAYIVDLYQTTARFASQ